MIYIRIYVYICMYVYIYIYIYLDTHISLSLSLSLSLSELLGNRVWPLGRFYDWVAILSNTRPNGFTFRFIAKCNTSIWVIHSR